MTPAQTEALKAVSDGGCLWQGDADTVRYVGRNNHGDHYVSREAVSLFAGGYIDKRGCITDAGLSAIAEK